MPFSVLFATTLAVALDVDQRQPHSLQHDAVTSYTLHATDTAVTTVSMPTMIMNTADLTQLQTTNAVMHAHSVGVTGVDFHNPQTAAGTLETRGVAAALASLGREALFLVTKLDKPPATMTDPEEATTLAEDVIRNLTSALEHGGGPGKVGTVLTQLPTPPTHHRAAVIDLLLMKDSTSCEVMQAQWAVLERALAQGMTRALGVYNFCESQLECLLRTAAVPPSINFLMRHVGMGPDATGIIEFSTSRRIQTAVYGTLGEPVALPALLRDKVVRGIAEVHGRSVEEVALKWNVQSGYAVSTRITADYAPDNTPTGSRCSDDHCSPALNAMSQVGAWELSTEEMHSLDALRLGGYPQPPTYYSSAACFASSEEAYPHMGHLNVSSCDALNAENPFRGQPDQYQLPHSPDADDSTGVWHGRASPEHVQTLRVAWC